MQRAHAQTWTSLPSLPPPRLGIKSLPFLARIPPALPVTKDGAVRLTKEDIMDAE